MERSAVYRRALAPTVGAVGATGVAGSLLGIVMRIETRVGFLALWISVALCSMVAAFVVVRRQALGAGEPFWSPPTRRVATALVPAFLAGAFLTLLGFSNKLDDRAALVLPGLWMLLYGCAVHAAGFFTPRGFRLFGWIFLAVGAVWLAVFLTMEPPYPFGPDKPVLNGHALMGGVFGLGHLAYAAYLHLTERKNAP